MNIQPYTAEWYNGGLFRCEAWHHDRLGNAGFYPGLSLLTKIKIGCKGFTF